MLRLQKDKNRDFLILNLTDTHLSDGEWAPGHEKRRISEGIAQIRHEFVDIALWEDREKA